MIKFSRVILRSILMFIGGNVASQALAQAPDMQAQMCNLQARELSLRVSEEMDILGSAGDREIFSALAMEVCLQYQQMLPVLSPSENNSTLSAPAQNAPAGATAANQSVTESMDSEDDGGLFDLEFIEPEDRVRRPGLKRR